MCNVIIFQYLNVCCSFLYFSMRYVWKSVPYIQESCNPWHTLFLMWGRHTEGELPLTLCMPEHFNLEVRTWRLKLKGGVIKPFRELKKFKIIKVTALAISWLLGLQILKSFLHFWSLLSIFQRPASTITLPYESLLLTSILWIKLFSNSSCKLSKLCPCNLWSSHRNSIFHSPASNIDTVFGNMSFPVRHLRHLPFTMSQSLLALWTGSLLVLFWSFLFSIVFPLSNFRILIKILNLNLD